MSYIINLKLVGDGVKTTLGNGNITVKPCENRRTFTLTRDGRMFFVDTEKISDNHFETGVFEVLDGTVNFDKVVSIIRSSDEEHAIKKHNIVSSFLEVYLEKKTKKEQFKKYC